VNVVFTLLVALPIGFFVRRRGTAIVSFVLAASYLFTFQTAFLVMKWVDGDPHAFGDRGRNWSTEQYGQFISYLVLNGVIVAIGVGLVILGGRIRTRRSRHDIAGVVSPA
jgi:hypothetical protein